MKIVVLKSSGNTHGSSNLLDLGHSEIADHSDPVLLKRINGFLV